MPVSDQDRAKAFYTETLGFTATADNPTGTNGRWIDIELPGGGAGLTLVTWFPSMPPGSLKGLVVEVDDIDTTYERWNDLGVQFTSKPADQKWGRFATFDDPDGNGWVLMETKATS